MPTNGSSVKMDVIDNFFCPDCKVVVNVGRCSEGDALLHQLPMCRTFENLSAEDYSALVRRTPVSDAEKAVLRDLFAKEKSNG